MKKYILRALLAFVLLVPPALFLHYFLPRSVIVEVSQTDVRRLDNDNNRIGQSSASPGETRDVFFISASVPGSDEVLVFRNEDTEFACPPCYFKFNDSDINALAAKLANEKVCTQKSATTGSAFSCSACGPTSFQLNALKLETARFRRPASPFFSFYSPLAALPTGSFAACSPASSRRAPPNATSCKAFNRRDQC